MAEVNTSIYKGYSKLICNYECTGGTKNRHVRKYCKGFYGSSVLCLYNATGFEVGVENVAV